MDQKQALAAIERLKEQASKRKFSQSYDLVINLKQIDTKQNPLDFFVSLPHLLVKKPKIAAFVAQELLEQAKKYCDLAISELKFSEYQDRKVQKKLVGEYDYFIAQASLMPKIAQIFGKVLGVKGKMPNPKLGCVVPPNANLEPLIQKLQNNIRLVAKKASNLQCIVGKEGQPEEKIADNMLAVYQTIVKQLPQEKQNIKNVLLKYTMSKPVKVE